MNLFKSKTTSIILATALLATAGIAHANTLNGGDSEGIVGGTTVKAGDPITASTVVIVGNESDGEYLCTGSLIAEDIVVTAAHCVTAPAADMKVVFSLKVPFAFKKPKPGAGTTTQPTTSVPVAGYLANPDYKGEQATGPNIGDIAIIRLGGPLPAGYHPATLLTDDSVLKEGAEAELAGYGITNATSQKGAGTLREVDVTIAGLLSSSEVIIDQTDGKGACHGDSGGPAFALNGSDPLLWGVTSRGYPDNAPDDCVHQSIYTKISSYSDWISQAEAQLRNQ